MAIFRCPECLSEFTREPDSFRCVSCDKDYPIVDGLPFLARNPDFYYGEIPKETMQAVVAKAFRVGWRKALLEHADAVGAMDFHNYVASELRAGFKFLLDRFETGVLLDYGCGPGAITVSLARNFARVYATDLAFERVRFTQVRARQENLCNVTAFCSGDTAHIPLSNGSVDVIILNGVLEWVPEFRSGEPRSVQIGFLKELRRILTEDGFLFIGIENRTGFGYLLGKKEEHSRLRFVALLPRKVADLYSQVMRGKPFRNYTYSRFGYRSLLKSAGFPAAGFWGFIPDYREVHKAIRLCEKSMIQESLSGQTITKRIRNVIIRPLFPWMSESFGILAGRAPITPYIERLVGQLSRTYLDGKKLEILQYSVTSTGTVYVRVSSGKAGYMIKLPLCPGTQQRMETAVRNMERIAGSTGKWLDTYLMPYPIAWGEYLGQTFLVEPLMVGLSLDKLAATMDVRGFFSKLCEYLVLLCKSTRKLGACWPEILGEGAVRYGLPLIEMYHRRGLPGEQFDRRILELVDYLKRKTPSAKGFYCAIHGDFWHGNIVAVRKDMRIIGILDWDRFEPESLPFLDLFNLITKRDQCLEGMGWGDSVVRLHKALGTESTDVEQIRKYASQIGVDTNLIPRFLIVYWMRQCLFLLRDDVPQLASVLQKAVCKPLSHFHSLIRGN